MIASLFWLSVIWLSVILPTAVLSAFRPGPFWLGAIPPHECVQIATSACCSDCVLHVYSSSVEACRHQWHFYTDDSYHYDNGEVLNKSPAVNRVSLCESKREATNLQQYRWTIVTAGSVLLDIGKPEQRTWHCTTSHPTNTDRSAWTSQRPGQKGAFGHSANSQDTKTYSVTLGQNKDWTITMQAKRRHKS
jgi:hypothetical protein